MYIAQIYTIFRSTSRKELFMNAQQILDEIISLDARIIELRDRFDELDEGSRTEALETLCNTLREHTGPMDPIPMPLIRATDMVCGLSKGAVILGQGMSHPNPDIRELCGQSLITVSEESLEAILPAIDMAIEEAGTAAQEMPFVLTYIDDPTVTGQILRFLDVKTPEVVAAAIEALAEIRDPEALPALRKLVDDPREVAIEDEDDDNDDEEQTIAIGMLAKEAIQLIEANEE